MNLLGMTREEKMKKICIILSLISVFVLLTACGAKAPNKNTEVGMETQKGSETDVPETTETEIIETETTETESSDIEVSDEEDVGKFLSGKKLSVIGDSISTYKGYSNDATNANSTIGGNWVWYTGENTGVSNVNQTWWKKAADETGMEILVNNSWSGSQVFSGDESDAYKGRAENLHDNIGENAGTKPDVIAVYIGINDFVKEATFGSYSDELYTKLIKKNENGMIEYEEPQSFVEAYIIMVDKIVNKYTLSDVFLFTFLPNAYERFLELEEYNEVVRKVAQHYNITVVDLYKESEITKENYKEFYGDRHIHPNKNGMEAIKEVFVKALKYVYLD